MHFHLRNPIMIGKKKHKDIQYLTEVVSASEAVDVRGREGEKEAWEDESRERQLRKKLNEAFDNFVKQVGSRAREGCSARVQLVGGAGRSRRRRRATGVRSRTSTCPRLTSASPGAPARRWSV